MIRVSSAMIEVQRVIEHVARGTYPVLVLGETGIGKELVVRELHEQSARREGPLQVVNCAALPESLVESILFGHVRGAFTGADADRRGVFELARSGTLFLDEVAALTPSAQAALLRVLDGGCVRPVGGTKEIAVDARVVAATNRDLAAMVNEGRFRLDLFHRLNVLAVRLPPLRERREEIAPLAEHFLARFAQSMGAYVHRIELDAKACLLSHDWPGNARDLLELPDSLRAVGHEQGVGRSHAQQLEAPANEQRGLRALLRDHEERLIHAALERTGGNQRQAAELLDVPLRTLERKLANRSRA